MSYSDSIGLRCAVPVTAGHTEVGEWGVAERPVSMRTLRPLGKGIAMRLLISAHAETRRDASEDEAGMRESVAEGGAISARKSEELALRWHHTRN